MDPKSLFGGLAVICEAGFLSLAKGGGCPATGDDPDEVVVRNLKAPLIRQVNGKGFEWGLLSCLSDLF